MKCEVRGKVKKVCNSCIFLMFLAVLITFNYKTAFGAEGSFSYYIESDEDNPDQKFATITGYSGQEENIVIPDEIEGCKVTAVSFYEEENPYVKSITLPAGISEIGWFNIFTSLSDIYVSEENNIYSSVDGVLYNKSKDTVLCVPRGRRGIVSVIEGTKNIGYCAFYECTNVTQINIPSSVEYVNYTAFAFCDCSSMDIKIDDGNTHLSIKDGMLIDKQEGSLIISLTSGSDTVIVPADIKKICTGAFCTDTNLKKIIVSSENTIIEPAAFADCMAQEIVLPEGIETIPMFAFQGCTNLEKIKIPSTVTQIEVGAFRYCQNLQEITIPENVVSIGMSAFYGSNLKNIYIESLNITEIGQDAFFFYEGSPNIYVHDEKTYNLVNEGIDNYNPFNLILVKDSEPLELSSNSVTLYTGNTKKSATIKAVLTGIKGSVKWTTSDKSVATVKNGKITAVKKGSAIVTASVSGHKKKVKVTVKNPTITVVDGSESISNIKVKKGKTVYLRINLNPAKSGVKAVVNKVSKKYAKITVKNTILSVKGIKKGTFTFKLQSGKGSKPIKVKVV